MLRRLLSNTPSAFAAFSTTTSATFTRASMTTPLAKPCKFALVQLATGNDKAANLLHAKEKVTEAAKRGADVVVLPECFNSPYGTEHFPKYAEPIPTSASTVDETASPSYTAMSALAASLKIHLIAGSIPERETGSNKLYNTSMIFNPSGTLVATHRKTHLFDIDIPGKIRFIESEVLSAGRNAPTLIDLPGFGRVAVAICYDVRFPELAMIAARKGAFALVYPGAFNMTTGPLHWELLARARAVDNQVYVAMCSPARDMDAGYNAWGSSMVVDPNAEVVVKAGSEEETVECVLDPERIRSTRAGIPVTTQRRFDVYADVSKVSPTDPPGKDGEAKGEGVEEPEDFDIRWIRSKCQPYLRK